MYVCASDLNVCLCVCIDRTNRVFVMDFCVSPCTVMLCGVVVVMCQSVVVVSCHVTIYVLCLGQGAESSSI